MHDPHESARTGRRRMALHWKIFIGLSLGIVVGVVLHEVGGGIREWAESAHLGFVPTFLVDLNTFIKKLFVMCLSAVAVPIILCSLIVSAAGVGDLKKLGRMGGRTVLIFGITALISTVLGLGLVNLVKPGERISPETRDRIAAAKAGDAQSRADQAAGAAPSTVWTVLLDAVPTNPFAAMTDNRKMLQVVVFALAIGIGLTMLPRETAAPVVTFFEVMTQVILTVVALLMRCAPIAVFCLIVPEIAALGMDAVRSLAVYAGVVVAGLILITYGVYPLLIRILTPMGMSRFFRGIAPAQMLAFTSSSSAATLPVTVQCVRDRLGVPEEETSFVCSLGTTINMDGTALYMAVGIVFLSQLYQVPLSFGQQVTLVLTVILAAVGAPGIPSGSIVLMIGIMNSLGISGEKIAIILALDRVLDMCRTVTNVTGDATCAVIVAHGLGVLPTEEEAARRVAERAAG